MPSILFIVPELLPVPPTQGGAVEHWVHEVSQRLAAGDPAGAPGVRVISRPADGPGGPGAQADPHITYRAVPWTRAGRWMLGFKQTASRRNPLRALAKLANVLGYAWGVRRLMREAMPDRRADILYVHNDPLLALLLPKRAGQQLVLHLHNDHLSVRAARALWDLALRRVDRVLCVSDHIRDRARHAHPRHAARMQTVLNATDTALFRPAEVTQPGDGTCHFLYVGRLTADKGVHVLIEAFAHLHAAGEPVCLLIAGSSFFADAPQTDYQRALSEQARPCADSLRFTGFVPHAQLRALYAQADVVVVPSVWQEPFGLVALEAMSSGACLIASAVGGLPELVQDGITGLLVAPDDPAALAAAMRRVRHDPALRARLGAAARQVALARFGYARLADEIRTCFDDLIACA